MTDKKQEAAKLISTLIPLVETVRPDVDDPVLNRWADERAAIFGSLDAAMTRHILDAIGALSELKQEAETEAALINAQLGTERNQLERELEGLRLEHVRLTDLIREARRNQEEEQARQFALEKMTQARQKELEAEQQDSYLEIRRLKVQLEMGRHELHEFYRNRSTILDAGGYEAWLEKQEQIETKIGSPITPLSALFASVFEGDAPYADEPPTLGELQEFGNTPTPLIPGGSPIVQSNGLFTSGEPPITNIKPTKIASKHITAPFSIGKRDNRSAMRELGDRLGLKAITPPPTSDMRFAPGYTPPSRPPMISDMLDIYEPMDFVEDADFVEEFDSKALEEVLEASEAALNSYEVAPLIGQFQNESITPAGQIRGDKLNPTTGFKLTKAVPPRKVSGFKDFPMPLPTPARPANDAAATVITKITVSNLQGPYSPLVLEKVVRSLAGVAHVIVTYFSKGVLEIDVRHEGSLDLATKLLSMSELRLKLLKQDQDAIEFSQETIV